MEREIIIIIIFIYFFFLKTVRIYYSLFFILYSAAPYVPDGGPRKPRPIRLGVFVVKPMDVSSPSTCKHVSGCHNSSQQW